MTEESRHISSQRLSREGNQSHAYLQAVFIIIATVAIATIRLRIHLEIGVRLFATARRRHRCHGRGDPLKL